MIEISKKEAREIANFLSLLYDLYKAKKDHAPSILAHAKRLEEELERRIVGE